MWTNLREQQKDQSWKKNMISQEDLNTLVLVRTKVSQGWKAQHKETETLQRTVKIFFKAYLL